MGRMSLEPYCNAVTAKDVFRTTGLPHQISTLRIRTPELLIADGASGIFVDIYLLNVLRFVNSILRCLESRYDVSFLTMDRLQADCKARTRSPSTIIRLATMDTTNRYRICVTLSRFIHDSTS